MKLKYIISFIAAISVFFFWQNNDIMITRHNYINNKIPKDFNGFKILHISDLHNKSFHGRLIKKIKEINPDIIVITGDLIDRRKTNLKTAIEFIEEIVKIAPVYYVSGNHEQLSKHFDKLKIELNKLNVINLDNSNSTIKRGDNEISIIGIADPSINFHEKPRLSDKNEKYARANLNNLTKNLTTNFNILLCHRPELFKIYKEFNVDLVFSGHTHGGQIRIPVYGGIFSPNQGLFPKLSEGIHKDAQTSMVVSRGLGNSLFPFRIFNRPEVVVVSLFKN